MQFNTVGERRLTKIGEQKAGSTFAVVRPTEEEVSGPVGGKNQAPQTEGSTVRSLEKKILQIREGSEELVVVGGGEELAGGSTSLPLIRKNEMQKVWNRQLRFVTALDGGGSKWLLLMGGGKRVAVRERERLLFLHGQRVSRERKDAA